MSYIEKLYRDYGDFCIDIAFWDFPDTGVTALWGPSGSGKSSILRLLCGLEECPSLVWRFKGRNLAEVPAERRNIGIVFQDYGLFPHLTTEQNLRFAAKARRLTAAETEVRLQQFREDLNLSNFWERKASLLSGGEQQRVALARALMGQPDILMLDEPFTSLDVALKEEARALVRQIVQKHKLPTLLVTHDLDDVFALADTVIEIKTGRITQILPVKEFRR